MSKQKRLARAEKCIRTVLAHEQETDIMLRNYGATHKPIRVEAGAFDIDAVRRLTMQPGELLLPGQKAVEKKVIQLKSRAPGWSSYIAERHGIPYKQ